MRRRKGPPGVTLVELLVTLLISSIAFFGLAVPLVSERSFWRRGGQQSEAQRDAQMALRALERNVRESSGHNLAVGASASSITFNVTCPGGGAGTRQFTGGPGAGGLFQMVDSCSGQTVDLIDGNRSQVTGWQATAVSSRLVAIQMDVTHGGGENEQLQTELYLRNAT